MTIVASARGRLGPVMTGLALLGLAVAGYLLAVRLLGEAPACGPVKGCDTVAASPYATLFGVPVALYGVLYSLVLTVACAIWSRAGHRQALYVAYGLGLVGILAVAYLTYLEIFVIEAICVWCVTYAVTIIAGFIVVAFVAWQTAED
jgi:uncharacterized membrane protein